ncbi:WXG100 family type VII secretion target [Actinomadura parmotrematis]|uniref:WXG100 family type VII secretion target n=1 Tax=Actinomadura parmotrematis TaxID=2864039 RepID=A0ABS7FXW7_9ACTN|nr:hypothetical protein [Actinomadura parmotrematis]MBW8485287.1 hypothetical protein [Actinomadura parmotrematis]
MTADGYEVDADRLKKAGTGFHDGAVHLKQIFDTLNSALQTEGKCWGADDTGKQFEEGYLKGAESTLKAFGELTKGLDAVKKGVDDMAKNYKDAEHNSKVR